MHGGTINKASSGTSKRRDTNEHESDETLTTFAELFRSKRMPSKQSPIPRKI